MRRWPPESRQALRFLAAARYFLPTHLHTPPEWEEEYRDCLYHAQFQVTLEILERIGEQHAGHIDELSFWKELFFAAQHLSLAEHARRYETRLHAALQGMPF